jgi:hypothetical protein
MILRDLGEGISKPYSFSGIPRIVHRLRKGIGLPKASPWMQCLPSSRRSACNPDEEAPRPCDGEPPATNVWNGTENTVQNASLNEARCCVKSNGRGLWDRTTKWRDQRLPSCLSTPARLLLVQLVGLNSAQDERSCHNCFYVAPALGSCPLSGTGGDGVCRFEFVARRVAAARRRSTPPKR